MMNSNIKNMTQIAVFTAVLCILSPITLTLPLSPVPISIINLIIYIFAVILGIKKSLFGFFIYLLLGAVGLPVFSHWNSGIVYIFGPTGGYLIGFFFCSIFTSLGYKLSIKISENKIIRNIILASGMIVGSTFYYILGTIWLSYLNNLNFSSALAIGVLPFILGDILKIIVATIIAVPLKTRLEKFT